MGVHTAYFTLVTFVPLVHSFGSGCWCIQLSQRSDPWEQLSRNCFDHRTESMAGSEKPSLGLLRTEIFCDNSPRPSAAVRLYLHAIYVLSVCVKQKRLSTEARNPPSLQYYWNATWPSHSSIEALLTVIGLVKDVSRPWTSLISYIKLASSRREP